jgi:hypothetical protein
MPPGEIGSESMKIYHVQINPLFPWFGQTCKRLRSVYRDDLQGKDAGRLIICTGYWLTSYTSSSGKRDSALFYSIQICGFPLPESRLLPALAFRGY